MVTISVKPTAQYTGLKHRTCFIKPATKQLASHQSERERGESISKQTQKETSCTPAVGPLNTAISRQKKNGRIIAASLSLGARRAGSEKSMRDKVAHVQGRLAPSSARLPSI